MEKKLKPCPFCGGKITNYHTNHLNLNYRVFEFRCEGCQTYFSIPVNSKYISMENTEREMEETWNRRADNENNTL